MKKLMGFRLSLIWLVMAVAASAQNSPAPVLDIAGQPLRRGVEYYIKPAITDIGGPLTLISLNGSSCPKYVGQEGTSSSRLPVTFAPFEENENVVRERKNFKATFSAANTCGVSTTWKVGERDAETQKRLIEIGDGGRFGNYFLIDRDERLRGNNNIYNLEFCPSELCPTCRFECGNFEALMIENGERLMSLGIDDTPLAVQFEMVN